MQSSNAHASSTTTQSARLLPSAATAQPAYGRRQATLAAFSRRVLSVVDVAELFDAAARAVGHGLGATHVAAFEYDRANDVLHLRAGVGWRDGLVGRAVSHPGTEFHEGYALDRTEPIVVADHNSEIRFAASPLLVEHGVLSSVCAAVRHAQAAFGLLGAYATRARVFTQDDAQFLQVVADVVSATLARLDAEAALEARAQGAAAYVPKTPVEERAEPAHGPVAEDDARPSDDPPDEAAEATLESREEPANAVRSAWPPESQAWTMPAHDDGAGAEPEAELVPETGPVPEPQSGPEPEAASELAPMPSTAPESQTRADLSIDIVAWASEEPDLQASLRNAAEAIARFSGFPMVAIELWDAERETITGAATVFPGQEHSEPVEWPLHQTLAGPTIASAQPRFEAIDSTTPERREALQRIGAATFVCFPLIVREQVIGALSLASREPCALDDDLSSWLTRVCRAISWLVQNHRDGQAMRDAHEITAQVLDGLGQGVALVDPNGNVQHVNAALAELLKHPAARLEGRRFVDFVADEGHAADIVWSSSGPHEDDPRHTTLVAEDGERVEVDVMRRPLLHGDAPVGTILVVNDTRSSRSAPGPPLPDALSTDEESRPPDETRAAAVLQSDAASPFHVEADVDMAAGAGDDTMAAGAGDDTTAAERERAARIQLVDTLDGERSRLAQALENRLAPVLSALQLSLQTKAQDRDDLAADLRAVGIALSTIHRLAHRLHPTALEGSTLSSLLQDVLVSNVESRRVSVEVVGSEPPLGAAFKTRVYCLIQDAVSGAFEHASARGAVVRLGWSAEHLDLDIESHTTSHVEGDLAGRDTTDATGRVERGTAVRDESRGADGAPQAARETWAQRLETRAELLGAEVSWLGGSAARVGMRVCIAVPEATESPDETSI